MGEAVRHISLLLTGNDLTSSVNLRSGLIAVGALRPEEGAPQDPVALETAVIATGARPGDTGTKRELFTEETQTVLVFENGAVIRLSAAVADGQLLFLTNKATGKEVVTQVLRKRSFRPTNCYIDLEFTEPCPGFWGIEFPKSAKPAKVSTLNSVTEELSSDEDSAGGVHKAAVAPSLHAVERLKMEVAGLQTQLKSLPPPGETSVTGKEAQPDVKTAAQIGAEVARKEEEKRLEELFALEAKQEESNLPKRLVAYPQKSARRAALKRKVSKSLVAALVVTLAAAGLNWFGAFDGLMKKTVATKPPPSRAMLPAPVPSAQKTAVASVAPSPDNGSAKASAAPMESVPTNTTATSGSIVAADNKSSVGVLGLSLYATVPGPMRSASGNSFNGRDAVAAAEAKRRKVQPASELNSEPAGDATNAGAASSAKTTLDTRAGVGVIPDGDGYVGPKLVHGVKPVAPAEALKNYVTGNVNLDALVDAAGHVKSVTVIAGPAKLRETAIEDMKQYLYEPAKKNGKAVSAHVQVSLQFWYEP
jgi:hypothetical protein